MIAIQLKHLKYKREMKKTNAVIMNKLRSNAGESIGETLVALVISALALAMLAGVIATASRIIDVQKNKLDDYYRANEFLVIQAAGEGTVGTVVIEGSETNVVEDDQGQQETSTTSFDIKDGIAIEYYANDKLKIDGDPVYSYKLKPATN